MLNQWDLAGRWLCLRRYPRGWSCKSAELGICHCWVLPNSAHIDTIQCMSYFLFFTGCACADDPRIMDCALATHRIPSSDVARVAVVADGTPFERTVRAWASRNKIGVVVIDRPKGVEPRERTTLEAKEVISLLMRARGRGQVVKCIAVPWDYHSKRWFVLYAAAGAKVDVCIYSHRAHLEEYPDENRDVARRRRQAAYQSSWSKLGRTGIRAYHR